MDENLSGRYAGVAGELRSARAQRLGLAAASMACVALSLPGMALAFLGHMIGAPGGISTTASMKSGEPKQIAGVLVGAVGLVFSAPMLLRQAAQAKLGKLDARMAKLAVSCEEDALRLGREGKFEELGELLAAIGGKSRHPLDAPVLGRVALRLFREAIERDDGEAVARCASLSGGRVLFEEPGAYMSNQDVFVLAASKGAAACCEAFMAAGVRSNIPTPWEAAKKAGHGALREKLSAYHSQQVNSVLGSKLRPRR